MDFFKGKFSLTIILAITFFLLAAVALFISSALQLASYSDTVRISIEAKQEAIAQEAANTVSAFFRERINAIQSIIKINNLAELDKDSMEDLASSILGSDLAYRQILILGIDGEDLERAARISLYTAETITNIYESDLINNTSKNHIAYSEVYIDEVTNEPLVLISIPILNIYSDLTRYLFLEINLKFMWEIMEQIKIGKTGYAYVVDEQGYLIAFKDSARVLVHESLNHIVSVSEFLDNLETMEKNTKDYEGLLNQNVIGTTISLKSPQWAVIVEMPLSEANEPVTNNIFRSLLIASFISLLAGGLGIFIARFLVRPLIDLTKIASKISQGDLKQKAKLTGAKEISTLAAVFNNSNGFLTEIISNAKNLTENLNASTLQIQSSTKEQSAASSQTASSITEISATMEELSITAKQITSNLGELVISSQDSMKLLKKIETKLRRITGELSEITDISHKNTQEMEELGKRSGMITEMVELIKDVASKTNILSINAAIEASRQSSENSGFMVVASEIRSLSKETIESAKKAEQAGRDIQEFLNSIIKSSASESDKVAQSSEISKEIFTDIETMITKLNQNHDFTQKINTSIKQQEKASVEAAETMRQMTEVARQSAEASRLILKAIEEILTLNENLKKAVNR
ncbi:MAG: methyl-accepting chemotaxis protein [Spirochaetales bacterium]|nr:methyl-accepting chemotaxis protein [Spirochaetales bacterium]